MLTRYKVLLFFIAWFSLPAHSTYWAKEYNTYKNTTEFKDYINGVGNGYAFANLMAERDSSFFRKSKFFCSPDNLELTLEIYQSIIDKYLIESMLMYKKPMIEVVLYDGLVKTFPCD